MALLYGGSICFGASAAAGGAAGGIFWGTYGLWGGGSHPTVAEIDYVTIASTGNAGDFGNLVSARRYVNGCSSGDAGRGVFAGGTDGSPEPSGADGIEYVTISSLGDTADFGDLYNSQHMQGPGTGGDGNRGLMIGGEELTGPGAYYNPQISYITIASIGNSLDFGQMYTGEGGAYSTGLIDGVYCRIAGGSFAPSPYQHERITSVTVATAGNATDWGNLLEVRYQLAGVSSNAGRGVWCGGYGAPPSPYNTDVMQYLTIATMNDSLDFGNARVAFDSGKGVQNGPRGVFNIAVYPTSYTNEIAYITIASLGDSADFGDLTSASHAHSGSASGD